MMVAPSRGFPELPGVNGEASGEESEEEAGDLEPKNAGSVGEGTPEGTAEASCAAGEAAAAFADRSRSGNGGTKRHCPRGWDRSRMKRRRSRLGWGAARRGLRGLSGALAQLIRGHAGADSENPAEAVRLHEKSLAARQKRTQRFELPGGNIRR